MTDLSKVFKTTVKAIKLNLNINDLNQELGLKKPKLNKNGISNEALDLVKGISKLKEYLIENKSNYIQPNYLLDNHQMILDDDERIKFEIEAEKTIKTCSETLKFLHEKAFNQQLTSQYKAHLDNLFSILESYLKSVCRIYTEQKAIQVQRTIEKKNFSQLYTPSAFDKKQNQNKIHLIHEQEDSGVDNDLYTLDEAQMFEEENNRLFDSLTSMTQEIRDIQSQVVEIARLQEIFAEKILDQDIKIDTIQKESVKTNENITKGNDNIKDAMKNNAALRLWLLFAVIVLSFTLLFLDWYND